MQNSVYKELPIEKLKRGSYQPRRLFDPEALQELAESIRSQGLVQPIVVRLTNNNDYEIIAGERRWRAAQLVNLSTVPCIIRQVSDEHAAAIAAIENIQRQDLNPIEEATSYQRLVDEFGYLHEEVAVILGISRTKVTNTLRLLKLDPLVQNLIIDKKLSSGHAKVLVVLPQHLQYQLADKAINKGWSVRKMESEAKKIQVQDVAVANQDADILYLEHIIAEQMGTPIKLEVDTNQKSGWIKIRYFDNDILAGLLDKMGIQYQD